MAKKITVVIAVLLVVGLAAGIWAYGFKQRATTSDVTAAAYRTFGSGPTITCVAQDGNGSSWYCRSPKRWGDDPNCRTATVSVTGSITFARRTATCEG